MEFNSTSKILGIQYGHWSESPRKWTPKPLDKTKVLGKKIRHVTVYAGTYGMGGPGYLGIATEAKHDIVKRALIVGVWSAASWMLIKDKKENLVQQIPGKDSKEFLNKKLVGERIQNITVTKHTFMLETEKYQLYIPKDLSLVPIWPGTKEIKKFGKDDDLRKSVFLSPSYGVAI